MKSVVIWYLVTIFVLAILKVLITPKKKKKIKNKQNTFNKPSNVLKKDEEILRSELNDLSGHEFEHLLALYFTSQGYVVDEVGKNGNDGGVDLVIIDKKTGYRTAVQAKRYTSKKVPVQTIRELAAAKKNHNCILSMVITTSDLTADAKKEAEKFRVDYWHGALLERKLRKWKDHNAVLHIKDIR